MKNFQSANIARGEIYFAKLSDVGGSVQNGMRPVLIIQNDKGNKFSPTTIVVPITSKAKKPMPTHVRVGTELGLRVSSTILAEQIICINKSQIAGFVTKLPASAMQKVETALALSISLGIHGGA